MKNLLKQLYKQGKKAFDPAYQHAAKVESLGRKLYVIGGGKVFGGIFAAMKLPNISAVVKRPNIIVGSYESDIHPVLLDAILWEPDKVVNIGSAEGYFAVGLAMLLNDKTPVYAFEQEERHWLDCAEMAAANNIRESIIQKGFCSVNSLNEINAKRAFVLIDCEGGEMELLNPKEVPSLKSAFILCELHDFIVPNITAMLIERFKETHHINLVYENSKRISDYRILNFLESVEERELALAEFRHVNNIPDQGRWMVLKPKL